MVKYLSPFEITQTVIEKQDSVPVEDPEMSHEMSSAAGRFRNGDFSLISACEHLVWSAFEFTFLGSSNPMDSFYVKHSNISLTTILS